jgi:glycosyltransferase involved in cell wall biosynthesis
MKVVFLVHQFYPEFQAGTEKFVFNMAYMAQKSGNKVKVITYSLGDVSSFPYRSGGILYKEFHYQGIPVLAWRYEKEPGDLHYVIDRNIDLNFPLEILQQEKPDLIHSGHLMRVYPFILAAMKLNIPYVLTVTDFHLLCPKILLAPTADSLCSGPEKGQNCSKFCSDLPAFFIKERLDTTTNIIRNASAVVAPSRFVVDIFEHEVDGLQVHINHHGIRQSNITTRDYVYQPSDSIRFGYIGNLAVHKGVHVLVKAFIDLNSSRSSLSIFGPGEDAYAHKLAEMAGETDVRFMGSFRSEELSKVFNPIDVLVAPSICYETYSFVVHEALASEIPVIVSSLGGMAETIRDDINGFTFTAGDVQQLREVMQKILDDPTVLNDLKKYIRLETFVPNIEQEAYCYNQIYRSIVR